MPTDPTFAVQETDVSRHNGGTSGAPIKPRDVSLSDSKCWNGGQKLVNFHRPPHDVIELPIRSPQLASHSPPREHPASRHETARELWQ